MRVKHPKSLQTGCAEQTIWSTMLFSMISFTAVYYTTISIFQHIRAECATVLHENKAEYGLKAEQPKLWLCVCVWFFFFFQALLFEQRTFKRIIFFLLCVVLSFAYALCDQFDAMIMPCDTFRKLFAKI